MEYFAKQSVINGLDPLLGYAYSSPSDLPLLDDDSYKDGLIFLKNPVTEKKIVILGGSTSDIAYEGNWIRPFNEEISAFDNKITLISGAFSGYSSSQELLKLLRDIVPLKPHLVISLSGVNDIGFIQCADPKYPLTHLYVSKIFQFLQKKYGKPVNKESLWNKVASKGNLRPSAMNSSFSIGKVVHGFSNNISDFKQWHRNIRLMKSICSEFNIKFISFLQPIFGFGKYTSSTEEDESFMLFLHKHRGIHGKKYFETLQSFYENAVKIVSNNPDYMVDLTNIFLDEKETFSDPRHLNQKGNNILCNKIFEYLIYRGLLSNA
jgi:hypothetical protein